jgi:hypothetical protein
MLACPQLAQVMAYSPSPTSRSLPRERSRNATAFALHLRHFTQKYQAVPLDSSAMLLSRKSALPLATISGKKQKLEPSRVAVYGDNHHAEGLTLMSFVCA